MIIKRNFNPLKVIGYIWAEVLFCLVISGIVMGLSFLGIKQISIPFSITATLGSALAIFIGFRNNSSYSRWWEARGLWANIEHGAKSFTRLIITFTDSHSHQPQYNLQNSEAFKKEMALLVLGWVNALRLQLRNQTSWHELLPFMKPVTFDEMSKFGNKPLQLQLSIGRKIYEAMSSGILAGFDSFQLEGQLSVLAQAQSACEKIKHTPLLRQYHFFTKVFLYAFILLLPFSMLAEFKKIDALPLFIPIMLLIAAVFAIMAKVGEVNENPFENKITDVPLTQVCHNIERDVYQLLGEEFKSHKTTSEINDFIF